MTGVPFPSLLPAGHQSSQIDESILTRLRSSSAGPESRSAQHPSPSSSEVPLRPRQISNYLFFDAIRRSCSAFSEPQRTYPKDSFTGGAAGHEQEQWAATALPVPSAPNSVTRPIYPPAHSRSPRGHHPYLQSIHTPPQGPPSAPRDASHNRNALKLALIADGLDTRTTVMIHNIPNRMSVQDLFTYIASVWPRKIDFLYLRMDFDTGRNCGYAFVNFITVQALLYFAQATLGQKWPSTFLSEKVMHITYADIQGKEALMAKFKNSRVMTERESWQPKYSTRLSGLSKAYPSLSQVRGLRFIYGGGQKEWAWPFELII
ncbi:RNA recognition motif 2-domain-containing protein, partial [Mycena olivaceomarginata]